MQVVPAQKTDQQLDPVSVEQLSAWWAAQQTTSTDATILQTVVKVQQGNAGGSGVMVGRAANHEVIVLSAAHIFRAIGHAQVSIDGVSYPARVVHFDRKTDAALLTAKVPESKAVVTTLVAAEQPAAGTVTVKIGFPAYAKGQANVRWGPVVATRQAFLFNAQLYVRSGDSGGGVFTEDGRLVSIVSGYTSSDTLWGTGTESLKQMLIVNGWDCAICKPRRDNAPKQPRQDKPLPKPPGAEQPSKPMPPAEDLRKVLEEIAALRAEVAGIKPVPGPAGPKGDPGESGSAGPRGPTGSPGKDADLSRLRALEEELEKLRSRRFRAELLDEKGNLKQTVEFGPDKPLRIKLVPVK